MARTQLHRLVWPLLSEIDRALERREITERQRNALYKALLYMLMGEPAILSHLDDFCRKHRRGRALEKLYLALGTKVKLPQALYSRIVQAVSLRNVLKTWNLAKSDIDLVNQIVRTASLDPYDEHWLLRRNYPPTEFDWIAEVEYRHEEVEIAISPQALEDMLLSVFETYKVPKSKKEPFSEVFGLCLGMASSMRLTKRGKGARTRWFIHVEKAVPQIRAKTSSSSVTPSAQSLNALIETSNSLFPQLEIIGDYHSHPYKSYPQLKRFRGWSASREDAHSTAYLYRDLRKTHRQHRMRVSFVVAIAKGRGTAISDRLRSQPNIVHFNMAGCHVFLSAYRILSNGQMTPHGVTLRRPHWESYRRAG